MLLYFRKLFIFFFLDSKKMSISTCSGYGPGSGCVANDFDTAFVSSDASSYSTVLNQDMALKIPLGSQLNLLNARNAGNPFVDFARVNNVQNKFPVDLSGYNTLSAGQSAGPYFSFSQAYYKS